MVSRLCDAHRVQRARLFALLLAGCGGDPAAQSCDGLPLDDRVTCLLEAMTASEKVAQMHGSQLGPVDDLYVTPAVERLRLPGFAMVDGPRGVRAGHATAFPVGMARGATWDPALEERVGEAIGRETAAKGGNVLLAPTINVLRHPAWGRAQETYGEDTLHIGRMGVGFIVGAQQHVIASAKHFAGNSIEDTRFEVDVTIDERTLREQYLPHFRMAVQEANVGSVMSAYNQVNGLYCAESPHLLRDILKGEWGFEGFVESDWILGTRSTVASALAGLDIEMPAPVFYGARLEDAVAAGEVPMAVIDEAARRVIHKKLEFAIDGVDPNVGDDVVESEEHLELAREVANKSLVLLKNEGALPLSNSASVALIGALADVANLGDEGSSAVEPTTSVSPYAGFVDRLGEAAVSLFAVDVLDAADASAASAADAVVVVVGLTGEDEGEKLGPVGGDRDTLALSDEQQALILQVAALHDRTIVVLEGGASITMEGWIDEVEAVVMAWYPGQQGGFAVADVVLGAVNPSGRLPITFPVSETQLPAFDHTSAAVTYGYFHGYRHVDHEGLDPLFPFGFGLSYTTFTYGAIRLDAVTASADATVTAEVDVSNGGTRPGEEVVQIYVAFDDPPLERAPIELKGFSRIAVDPGETVTARIEIDLATLGHYDGGWQPARGPYRFLAGSSSRDLPLEATLTVE